MRLGFAIAAAAPVAASTGPVAPFVLAAAAIAPFLGKIFGFGPDPEKKAYDQLRGEYLSAYNQLTASVEPFLDNMSREDLGRMIQILDKLRANFSQATDYALQNEDRDWILPRYRDVYDPILDTLDRWTEIWQTKPIPYTQQAANLFTSVGGSSWLGPLALVGVYLVMRRR